MKTKEKIREFVAENYLFTSNGFNMGDQESFLESGVVDSLGVLELVAFVEDSFGIEVPDDDVIPANFDSVDNLAAYISRKQGSA